MRIFLSLVAVLALLCPTTNAQTIVERHGQLRVVGNKIKDECDRDVQLRGMSYFWSQWPGSRFFNEDAIRELRDDWKVTSVRLPLGVNNSDNNGSPDHIYETRNNGTTVNKDRIRAAVDGAIQHGIYAVIDWHAHPEFRDEAVTFFQEMAQAYGNQPNVIYEIWNEPIGPSDLDEAQGFWDNTLKPYHEEVIAAIRDIDPDNIIVVGTPFYDQFISTAVNNPITQDSKGRAVSNIAYTLHFYAAQHKQFVRDQAQAALDAGMALWVTECGRVGTNFNSLDNPIDQESWDTWEAWMDANKISWNKWSMSDKAERSSSFTTSAPANGPWDVNNHLTDEGRWNRNKFRDKNATLPSVCDDDNGGGGGGGSAYAEVGNSRNNHTFTTVELENTYSDPVVILGPLSVYGGHKSTTRVKSVTSTSFQWRVEEWEYLDGAHASEYAGYLVMDSGQHTMSNGAAAEAGKASVGTGWKTVNFGSAFSATPTVLVTIMTENGADAVAPRIRNVSTTGFQVRIEEEENGGSGNGDRGHTSETVGWVAMERAGGDAGGTATFEVANTGNSVTEANFDISFNQSYGSGDRVLLGNQQTTDGGDPCVVRYRRNGSSNSLTANGVRIFLEEEQSKDTEIRHTTEAVGYAVFDGVGSLTAGSSGGGGGGGSANNSDIYDDNLADGWQDWSWNGEATVQDGLASDGSFAFKYSFTSSGGVSFRHPSGKTGDDLLRLEFTARTWTGTHNFNVSGSYDDDYANRGTETSISIDDTYSNYTFTKSQLGNYGWYKRFFLQGGGNNVSVFIDEVRLVYASGSNRAGAEEVVTIDGASLIGGEEVLTAGIAPNPSNGAFTLRMNLPEAQPTLYLELFDLNGRVLATDKVTAIKGLNRYDLSYDDVAPGMYYLRVSGGEGVQATQRVIIR